MECRICGENTNYEIIEVKERQINNGDVFRYLYCHKCGTLQLIDNIEAIGSYYPCTYYSFDKNYQKNIIRKILNKLLIYYISFNKHSKFKNMLVYKYARSYFYLLNINFKTNSHILDVGSGSGKWLYDLFCAGFTNLTGVDLFYDCKQDSNPIKIIKGDIFNPLLKKYDIITFHHSFEHMDEPLRILKRARNLLRDNGVIIIRIPVNEGTVWDEYREDWYQIDAPRHLYLYTVKSFNLLAKKADLCVENVIFDSDTNQFLISDYYKNTNYSLSDIVSKINDNEQKKYKRKTKLCNNSGKGDQAIFYLHK